MLIDLNADLGEGADADPELMPLVTSANVACGLHAGSVATTAAALRLAARHGVTAGAHPGYADPAYLGRRELALPLDAVTDLCVYQIGAVVALAGRCGTAIKYVKPHGALYNQANRDRPLADAVVKAVAAFGLPVVGLPGGEVEAAARGVAPFVGEGFADRRYRPDGSLVPRACPDAFVHDPAEAVAQVNRLVRDKGVRTVCVHGDNPDALRFAGAVREALRAGGFTLRAFA